MGHAYQNVETGVEPVRRPVRKPISVFNILKTEIHGPVAYSEDRMLPWKVAKELATRGAKFKALSRIWYRLKPTIKQTKNIVSIFAAND